ncbi:MAG: polyketide synthase dehydratase domain-containing protein [Proteobacteria bacterium]|nr:polyketide synthase dehydratase domain-containing protein [Pseudomonadota bacterium]MBU4296437.1 polyketide synthase dehydratase domain-containing protein [Pseudomonadota bacterium]MCG2748706.1 polyketide synthase dehydratase domain-containing protein [Desulfobulbaceae bacterium]
MTLCTPVDIAVRPWFFDHRFNGMAVLPAVESMALLAAEIHRCHPEIDTRVMEHVRFAKFLEIPAGSTRVAALIEHGVNGNGAVCAKLLSRVRFKAGTRLKEHGEIVFPPARFGSCPLGREPARHPAAPGTGISVEKVYRELVPFGPAYHSLQESLYLSGEQAWGKLQAPALPAAEPGREMIGSPFPLDGAFHAACVLGQRHADFVPFPVGFARRLITQPTQAGCSYFTKVQLISRAPDELVFDLNIFDDKGGVFETVTGLRMRDVSGGRIKPPTWIRIRNEQ